MCMWSILVLKLGEQTSYLWPWSLFCKQDPFSSIQCFSAFKPSNMCPLHERVLVYLCQYSSPGLVSGCLPFIMRYDPKCVSFYLMLLEKLDPMLPSPTKNEMRLPHYRDGLISLSIKPIWLVFFFLSVFVFLWKT